MKGRSGLNDVYQSHQNVIDHSSMRNFLRMAHQHDIAFSTPGSKLKGGPPDDMYVAGIKKLREYAKEKKLGRFQWHNAGGLHLHRGTGEDSNTEEDCDSSPEHLSSD